MIEDPTNIVQVISRNLCNPGHEVLRRTLGVYLTELNTPLPEDVRSEMRRLLSQALMLAAVPDLRVPKTAESSPQVDVNLEPPPSRWVTEGFDPEKTFCNICRDPRCSEPNQKH